MKKIFAGIVLFFVSACALAQSNVPNGSQANIPVPGGVSGPAGSSALAVFNVAGAVGNGVADDQAAINATLTQCGNAGGGLVVLESGKYLVDTVGLTVPSRCIVFCPVPLLGNNNPTNYSNVPYSVIVNPAVTIAMGKNSGWQGCPVLSKAVINSTAWADYPTLTYRDLSNLQAAFAGTGFTYSSGDVQLRDLFIGGFALGINASGSGTARQAWDHVNIDATKCLLLDNSHDISRLNHIECFPFITSGMANVGQTFPISGIANNGSGLYRVTLATPTSIPQTGDVVWIDQTVVGPQSVQARRWTITVIDTTHFDLQGSAGTGSITPTVTTHNISKAISGLSSSSNLGVGQTCTGTGIPASSTIQWLAPAGLDLGINNLQSANGTVTATCTDTAYVSGGNAILDAGFRNDIGMEFTNSEGIVGQDLFVFGHSTGYHLGTGMTWFSCSGCWSDGPVNSDISVTSLLIDSTSKGNTWIGGRLNNQAVRVNSSSAFGALSLVGVSLDSNASNWVPLIEQDQGIATYTSNMGTNGNSYYLFKDAITRATITGNDFNSGQLAFETGVGDAKVNPIGNTLNPTVYAGGAIFQNQRVTLGNVGSTCTVTDGNSCLTTTGAPFADGSTNTQNMVTGGTIALSGNSHLTLFHGTAGSTLATLTITMPGPARIGGEENWFFDQAITTLTINGTTQTGMPTSINANTWYKCIANTTSNYFCGPG